MVVLAPGTCLVPCADLIHLNISLLERHWHTLRLAEEELVFLVDLPASFTKFEGAPHCCCCFWWCWGTIAADFGCGGLPRLQQFLWILVLFKKRHAWPCWMFRVTACLPLLLAVCCWQVFLFVWHFLLLSDPSSRHFQTYAAWSLCCWFGFTCNLENLCLGLLGL